MHASTFEYLKPTDEQIATMARVREAAKVFAEVLDKELPDGPDKTYAIRHHRTTAMWVNVASPDDALRRINLARTVRNMFLTVNQHKEGSIFPKYNDTLSIALQLNMRECDVCDLLYFARASDGARRVR